jgi:hypothetical protein
LKEDGGIHNGIMNFWDKKKQQDQKELEERIVWLVQELRYRIREKKEECIEKMLLEFHVKKCHMCLDKILNVINKFWKEFVT